MESGDDIPADARELVNRLKGILNCPEQEIYAMLVECNMDPDEAMNRLLSRDTSQEEKSKQDENLDDILVKRVKEVLNLPKQEILPMLVECNMDANEAIYRLLSQDTFKIVKNKRDKKNETKNTRDGGYYNAVRGRQNKFTSNGTRNRMAGSPTTIGIPAPSPSNSDLTSGECKRMPANPGEAVDSLSATSSILSHQPPSNSDLTNGETKRMPVSSGEAVSSLSVPSSKYGSFISGERTMAEIVKRGLSSSKESVIKAPVKDDSPLHEKPDASVIESNVRRDQLVQTALISNQSLRNEDVTPTYSDLTDGEAVDSLSTTSRIIGHQPPSNSKLTRCESKMVPISSGEAVTSLSEVVTKAPAKDNSPSHEKPDTPYSSSNSFIESAATHVQLSESALVSNQNLRDDDVTFASKINKLLRTPASEYNQNWRENVTYPFSESYTARSDPLRNFPDEFPYDSNEALFDSKPGLTFGSFGSGMYASGQHSRLPSHSEFSDDVLKHLNIRDAEFYDQRERAQDNQCMSSLATDFTFDNSHWLNHELTPSESSPQMQNFNTFSNVMPMPKQHNSTTASSVGRKPSGSMTEKNRLAMNHHNTQPKVLPGHYGDTMKSPYSPPKQNNNAYNMSPLALQQHGGTNNNVYRHQSLAGMPPQYRNSNLPQSAVNIVPSTNSSAYGFSTPGYNTANSRLGSSQFNRSSHLTSFQHQTRNSNVWPPQGHNDSRLQPESDYYSLMSGPQNQQSPSFGQSQQVQQYDQHYRGFGYERSSPYNEYLMNQQNARRDPSANPNQPQQQPWPRNNY